MNDITREMPTGFHILAKPNGPICNLNCRYCFYLEKTMLYPQHRRKSAWAMSEDTLESFIRQYIQAQDVPAVNFAWQGGEPTLLGINFFRKALALQQKYSAGKKVENVLQTNGILLEDRWCEFFAKHAFLIGLSLDGPRRLHDRYRVDREGAPSFDRVMGGLSLLKQHGVPFNSLTAVHRHNSQYPLEVYRFLKEAGSRFMQFIPIVERITEAHSPDGPTLASPDLDAAARVSD